jgi:hypothetical protein
VINFVLGIDEGPNFAEINNSLENIRTAHTFVFSPEDNTFWYGEIFYPHACIEIPYGVIHKKLFIGYELELNGTTGSVVIFGMPVELSSDEINSLYKVGKLPLDSNCNLVLPTPAEHMTTLN